MLIFIGLKMLSEDLLHGMGREIPEVLSLAVIATCIGGAALFSWLADRRDSRTALTPPPGTPEPGGEHEPREGQPAPPVIAGDREA